MTVDVDLIIKLIPILLSLAALVTAVIRTRRSEVDERFKTGAQRMDRHESRLQALEQTVSHLPGKSDMHAIELNLANMKGDLGRIEAQLAGNGEAMTRISAVTERLEGYLLNTKG